jgi:hypothetical protein
MRQLQGNLTIASSANNGTRFLLDLPVLAQAPPAN